MCDAKGRARARSALVTGVTRGSKAVKKATAILTEKVWRDFHGSMAEEE
jgi:hypothetical protein